MPQEDYLEVDKPVPGQNYVCLSFVSPEKTLKERELFLFNKFINQRCGEWELKLDEIVKDVSDDYKNKINSDIKDVLRAEMKFTLEEFKNKYEDFKYKFNDDLEKAFTRISGAQTSVRGVKIRGVYDSKQEAERRAKDLQVKDRSFHIFVGQVGYWLPWDPQADKIEDETFVNSQLNDMMEKYKENTINKDIFYEEEKRDRVKAAREEVIRKKKEEAEKLKQEAIADGELNVVNEDEPCAEDEPCPEDSENVIKEIVDEPVPEDSELKEDIKETVGNVDEETKQSLEEVDPWMARKVAEQPTDSTEDKKEQ